ncbi:MAG: hypothetical protein E6K17_01530 [Methanobacteriota archaeon]|nr:MAG: hypothetical protein E6K17_01530 [Euryarchaeota archaeon]
MLALALVLTFGTPALLALGPAAPTGAPVKVIAHAPLAQVAAIAPGIRVIEAYDSFVLVDANPQSIAALQARGIAVEVQDEGTWISLQSVRFDTRIGEPTITPDLAASPTAGSALYLLHFIGPSKPSWLQELRSMGVRVLQSIPTYAFLVSMDAATRSAVQGLRFVDWVGPYHPAFKLQSELGTATGIVTVQILTVDSKDTDNVVAFLANRGIPIARWNSLNQGILSTYRIGEMGVVRARFDASLLSSIARIPTVMYVEPWREMRILDSNAQALLQTGLPPTDANARRLWTNGINGTGEIIAMGDTGIDFDSDFFRQSTAVIQKGQGGDPTGTIGPLSIYNTTDMTRRKLVRYIPMSPYRGIDPWTGGDPEAHKDSVNAGGCPSGHGTSTSGNAGGSDAGIGASPQDGMAIGAKIIIEDIGSIGPTMACGGADGDVLSYIPDNYDDLFAAAYTNGSRIHSNSWGATDNGYDLQAMMVDRFVWNHPDMAIFFAAGNAGAGLFTIGSPGTSKSTITIGGASEYPGQDNVAGQSSRGPTADGRLKPDTMTFFTGTTASSSGNPTDNANTGATTFFAGTSHATPLGAGMAALVRQYFDQGYYPTGVAVPANALNPSAALVKSILAASSRKMAGAGANPGSENRYPNDAQGWGRLVLDDALYVNPATEGARKLWVVDQTSGLITGQSIDYKIKVNTNAVPLRIVMSYSDYPAFPNSNPALVNNLNLQVTAPNGSVYKGNVFATFAMGESLPNAGSFDTRNPIEGVIVNSPGAGEWTIHVEGANIPAGPQAFAVVAVADLDPGYGDIRLDRKLYSESDTIRIEVHDTNAPSVSVNVRSTVETTPEVVALTQTAPSSGVWRGQILTAFGDPVADGKIQVSEGGTVEAMYSDANPAHDVIATASIDASAPAISNVRAEDITNGGATIKWTTSESADSKVYFGTNPVSLTSTGYDNGLVTAHALPLVGLQTDSLYYYDVESADLLGHRTRDSNGGTHYSFRTTAQGEILLVIGDGTFPADRVPMYRDALVNSAWTYNEWHVAVSGDPPLSELQKYKVVLWQTGLEQYPQLSDAQRGLVRSYMEGGGRFFLSSQDVAWSLCSTVSNPYYTPARCSWFRSNLKSVWLVDPQTWTRNIGIAGDLISGTYTGGVNYVGHRAGGYGDEVRNLCGTTGGSCVNAGATLTYVWRDSGGVATPDNVGTKFQSTANNGTVGVGVWGGNVTKAVLFYFEFTGINFVSGQVSDVSRTDILNRTIIWLVGRDHPAVRVRSPNGGEVITTNTATITWTRQSFGGTTIAGQTLYYSDNSGQSWNRILPDPLPTDTSYVWTVSGLPNGGRYRVRVVAQDSWVPPLTGADASDADFAINRTGGDLLGPLIWPGSVSIVPNPIVTGSLVTFRGTADDTNRGNSAIAGAEIFSGAGPGPDGTGTPMSAADGMFNSVVENLLWTATAPWPVGSQCFWVHARDASGNWGPTESRCTTVASTAGLDTIPPASTTLGSAGLTGGTFNDVRITWNRAPDEGQIGGTTLYRVFRATTLAGAYAQVGADVTGTGSATYSYTDVGAGDQAPSPTYFYRIRTVDAAGNTADSATRAGKFSVDLPAGRSLISLPLTQADTTLTVVLQTLLAPTPLRGAWVYDGCTGSWITYSSVRPIGQNGLKTIARGQGVYLDLVAGDRFTVAGLVPTTTRIQLCGGWNLVAFPSFASLTAGQVMAATGASAILDFDPVALPGQTRTMAVGALLQPGRGYWIAVAALVNWDVPGQ